MGEGFERSGSGIRTTSWTALMADYDNDGWEDGFVVHGYLLEPNADINPSFLDTSIFFHNVDGKFFDYTDQAMNGKYLYKRGRGGAFFDFNHDGKLDICFGSIGNDLSTSISDFRLLQNITPDRGHWMEMKFTAKRTAKEAIGTIVDVWAGGIVHSRQVSTGGGFGSQNSLVQHIGLGEFQYADSINIFWPADKYRHRQIDKYYHISTDHFYTVTENMTTHSQPDLMEGVSPNASVNHTPLLYPNPVQNILNIENFQPSLSTRLEIYDILGIKKAEITGSESSFPISLANLNPGCYTLRILSNGNMVTKQFIKK
jgi:hypothetical protein